MNTSVISKKRVLVLGDVSGIGPDYHVGDEAMAEVAISRLAAMFGRENLVLVCASPTNSASTYKVKAIPLYTRTYKQRLIGFIKRPHSALRELFLHLLYLWKTDLVFVAGGGNHTSVWPDVLESRLYFFRLALLLKKPILFASQTLGPFSETHRAACQNIFSSAYWVGVRDKEYSATQLNIPVHFAVDDAVFLPSKHNNQTKNITDKYSNLIGLSIRGFKGVTHEQQHDLCQALIPVANKHQASTIFIPHHAPAGKWGDLEIAQRISPLWPSTSPLLILNPIPDAAAVKALTGHCHFVVTMRYHQLIFSLSVGIPCIGIYVDEYTRAKLNGAFEQFGLKPYLLVLTEAPEKLASLTEEILLSKNDFIEAAKRTATHSLESNMAPYRKAGELLAK